MRYTDAHGTMIATDDGRFIPADPANADYTALIASGATIQPYVAPPPSVPAVVSPYQARAALSRAGLLASVETAVTAAGGETQIAWEYGFEVRRDSPMIVALAASLNLTPQAVDALFVAAGGIA